jgi:hypothetical protein
MNEKPYKTIVVVCCTLLFMCSVIGAGITGYNIGTRQASIRLCDEYETRSKLIKRKVEEFRESDERAVRELRDVLERNDDVLRSADSFVTRYTQLSEARDRCIQRLYDNSVSMCSDISGSLSLE